MRQAVLSTEMHWSKSAVYLYIYVDYCGCYVVIVTSYESVRSLPVLNFFPQAPANCFRYIGSISLASFPVDHVKMSDFWLTEYIRHLVVQPADARLNPPEGYLFVQDGLIISCGVLYALLYVFGMMRAVKDGVLPGSIKYLYAYQIILYSIFAGD